MGEVLPFYKHPHQSRHCSEEELWQRRHLESQLRKICYSFHEFEDPQYGLHTGNEFMRRLDLVDDDRFGMALFVVEEYANTSKDFGRAYCLLETILE